jgi:hypothetical protein
MTEHQGLPVSGYRPQPTANVEAVNANKRQEEIILRVLDILAKNKDVDQRWLAIGRTHIEQAFMAINRAIFKPARVRLPDDAPAEKPSP